MSKQVKIELNNKEYTFPFGLGFLGDCLENLGLNVFEIGKKLDDNPFKWIPMLMLESHKYNCYLNGVDVEFDFKQLIEMLDNEEGKKKMNNFLIAFINSLNKDVPKQENVKGSKTTPKKK